MIMFGAREQGFGRGFDEIDIEVFDEAQILTEKALEDMVAATNQSRHPHGALLFYMGTPPRPIDAGEAFTAKRTKALAGALTDGLYIEFSADAEADPDDQKQWEKANPSFPVHTPLASMLRLRENLPSDDAWMREALGIWDANNLDFPLAFASLGDIDSKIDGAPTLAVSMSPDQRVVALVAAGRRPNDGLWHVETVLQGPSGDWFVKEVAEIAHKQHAHVALAPTHPVGALLQDLIDAKVLVKTLNSTQHGQSCGGFHRTVLDRALRYPDPQPELAEAVRNATQKRAGDTFKWDGDGITTLIAASHALWAAKSAPKRGKGRVMSLAQ